MSAYSILAPLGALWEIVTPIGWGPLDFRAAPGQPLHFEIFLGIL